MGRIYSKTCLSPILLAGILVTVEMLAAQEPEGLEPEPAIDVPLIDSLPPPSRIVVRGSLLENRGEYHLQVEYETPEKKPHRGLLVYSEPSHRLLFVQWSREPTDELRREIEEESPLAVRTGDFARREVRIPFDPGEDDRILIQLLTEESERLTVLSGRVGDFRSFEVEAPVYD